MKQREISMSVTLSLVVLQGTVEVMETVSGAKEVIKRETAVQAISRKLKQLGTLSLVVPGKSDSTNA